MSTRSDIIVQRADGTWGRIYCHSDGHLRHNGKLLAEHYNSQGLAERLIEPGDISVLFERCDKPGGHSFATPVRGCSVYYGRDRDEEDVGVKDFDSLAAAYPQQDGPTEFTYVWMWPAWWVGDPDKGPQSLVPLSDAINGKAEIHSAIKFPAAGLVLGYH